MRYTTALLFLVLSITAFAQPAINFMPRLQGDDITYYALAEDFENMVGFQFSLNWNPDSMSFRSLDFRKDMKYGAINPRFSEKGQILMSWFAEGPAYSRKDCDTLFTMKFKSVEGISDVRITSTPLRKEVVRSSGTTPLRSKVIPHCGLTSSDDKTPDHYTFELIPTLVEKGGEMRLKTAYTKQITIELFDLGGKLLLSREMGPELTFEAPEVPGVYIYRVVVDNEAVHSDRFVVQ